MGARRRGPASRGRRVVTALAVIGLGLGLGGCTGNLVVDPGPSTAGAAIADVRPTGPDEWRRTVPLEPLTVPAEMVAPADRFDGGAMVSGTPSNPALVAAVGTRPGGERYLRVSRWTGTGFEHGSVTPPAPGSVQAVAAAGNATVTALAGWTWQTGSIAPFLLISTDRRSWTPVDLPVELAGYRIVAVAADGGQLVALAQHPSGSAVVVSLDPGGALTLHPLPDRPAGQDRDLTGLAVSGRTVVVIGDQGPAGSERPQVLRSIDGGATWTDPAEISAARTVSVSGIAALAGGFMITGAQTADGADQTGMRAAAWFSADAVTWAAESLPEADGFRWDDYSSAAGAPTAANGHLLVLIDSTSALYSRLLERLPSGQWIDMGATDKVARGTGAAGTVVPLTEPTGGQAPGSTLVAIEGAAGLSLGRFASGLWDTLLTPDAAAPLPFFNRTRSSSAERWRAIVRQRHLEPWQDSGWAIWWQPTEVGLVSGAIADLPWDPAELTGLSDLSNVVRSSTGDAELAMAAARDSDQGFWHIAGWFRPAPGQPWTPVTGFAGSGTQQQVATADKVGSRWFVGGWGRAATDGGADDQGAADDQAMIWSSDDGVSFTSAPGDFAVGDGHSAVIDICASPDGTPLAVGQIEDAQGTGVAALWTEQDGRWVRTDLPNPPAAGSSFSACAVEDGVLVIDGDLGYRSERWSWSAPAGFQLLAPPRVDRAGDGSAPSTTESATDPGAADQQRSELRSVQSAGSGYVASGRIDSATYTGPVLWVSPDAQRWQWVPLPVHRPDSWSLVSVVDQDVVILCSSATDSQAWRVPDIATVMAGMPASG